jgi:hypothetical protein
MADTPDLSKLVPGFDFLQGLVKNAGSALPSVGQWIAPTIDPEELAKRIDELRTVQFWLEQNVRMIATTIQAMEVQRMTLSTLKTMNVQMGDLRESMKLKMPTMPSAAVPAPSAAPPDVPSEDTAADTSAKPAPTAAAALPAGIVDPMQWWNALTQQFTQIAASAAKDSAAQVKAAGEAVNKGFGGASSLAPAAKAGSKRSDSSADSPASKAPGKTARKTARKTAPKTGAKRTPSRGTPK